VGATFYELYRDGSLIATPNFNSYKDSDEDLLYEINYNYAVKACNSIGCSGMSNSDSGYLLAPVSGQAALIHLLLLERGVTLRKPH
jgi:hypothetical protein